MLAAPVGGVAFLAGEGGLPVLVAGDRLGDRGILLYAGDDAPLDGVGELLVGLRDIGQILSRPALARLAKIEQIAEEVADGGGDGGGRRG